MLVARNLGRVVISDAQHTLSHLYFGNVGAGEAYSMTNVKVE